MPRSRAASADGEHAPRPITAYYRTFDGAWLWCEQPNFGKREPSWRIIPVGSLPGHGSFADGTLRLLRHAAVPSSGTPTALGAGTDYSPMSAAALSRNRLASRM